MIIDADGLQMHKNPHGLYITGLYITGLYITGLYINGLTLGGPPAGVPKPAVARVLSPGRMFKPPIILRSSI